MPAGKLYKSKSRKRSFRSRRRTQQSQRVNTKINALYNAIEMKYDDLTITDQVVTSAGIVNHLTSIAEGDASLNRTGLKITPTSLYGRFLFKADPAGFQNQAVRMMVVIDKQQVTDSTPSAADVLDGAVQVVSPLDRLFRNRFHVLYDKAWTMVSGANSQMVHKEFYLKIPKWCHTWYNGENATDIQKNGIYLLYLTQESGANEILCTTRS